jgi:hypothetical protein
MTVTQAGTKRMQRRRDKVRSAGLRPVEIWVPDTRAAGFAGECARQARLIREAEMHGTRWDEAAWAEKSDTTGWTA